METLRTAQEWRAYWQARGQDWRTEKEIDAQRQDELNACLVREADIERGQYPFRGVTLKRADVEWLLARQEQQYATMAMDDEPRDTAYGLDLRGADLQRADLHALPLTGLRGALGWDEWTQATTQQREWARANLEGTNLNLAQLEGASLARVNMQQAQLRGACLDEADLSEARAQGACFDKASLRQTDLRRIQAIGSSWQDVQAERANFSEASLQGAEMMRANLRHSNLRKASLQQADLSQACLINAYLHDANLQEASLQRAQLNGADLSLAYMMGANLRQAILSGVYMRGAHLEGSDLSQTQLAEADLSRAHLAGAILNAATLNRQTQLADIELADPQRGCASLADISWGDAVLSGVNWAAVTRQDAAINHRSRDRQPVTARAVSSHAQTTNATETIRAYRQLALVLRQQGLDEDSACISYGALILQRQRYWRRRAFGAWLCFLVLDLLAGYGYRPWRLLGAYALVILISTLAYFVSGSLSAPHLSLLDAALISITTFHGRIFWEDVTHPNRLRLWLMALEALAGLIIEATLVAVLLRRLIVR